MIYVVAETGIEDGAVKIGYTGGPPCPDRVRDRLNSLQTANPRRLAVIAMAPGSESGEKTMHVTFASAHVCGEWFSRSAEVQAFIDQHKCDHVESTAGRSVPGAGRAPRLPLPPKPPEPERIHFLEPPRAHMFGASGTHCGKRQYDCFSTDDIDVFYGADLPECQDCGKYVFYSRIPMKVRVKASVETPGTERADTIAALREITKEAA